MEFRIDQILLFPKNSAHKVQELSFPESGISVISGLNRRGKSALTHIIDYCLGSSKCSIPVGPIRSTVAWYGLLVQLGQRWLFIARREPGERQVSDEFCVHQLEEPWLPISPDKNTGKDAFKEQLNELFGVPRLSLSGQSGTGFRDSRPSYRDFAAFNFLPQHIVANPQTLFFKTDSTSHREKLIHVFPFVLDAVSAQYLVDISEESDLQKRVSREEDRLAARQIAVAQQRSVLFGLSLRAYEYGLLSTLPDEATDPNLLTTLLESAIEKAQAGSLSGPTEGATEAMVGRLAELKEAENVAARDVSAAKRALFRLESLSTAVHDYASELASQSDRARGVSWFRARVSDSAACPMCGTETDIAAEILDNLRVSYDASRRRAEALAQGPGRFEREIAQAKVGLREKESSLRKARESIATLLSDSSEAAELEQKSSAVQRFIGHVEATLGLIRQSQGALDDDSLKVLQEDLRLVQARMASERRREKEEAALARIGRLIGDYAEILNLERSKDEHLLVPKDLALVFRDRDGHRDFLWEVGSGENWMGYHLAVMLALHEYFLQLDHSVVLSFLVIDQPSQVYFPAKDSYENVRQEGNESSAIQSARRIFEALSKAVDRMNGKLQIIVTEHADELTWGRVPNVHLVKDWREDQYLIPQHWIDGQVNDSTSD